MLIVLEGGGSGFFVQKRVGKNFRLFDLYKFRTMVKGADEAGPSITAEGDCRITKIGEWLRKTKIDELPQLFNVLKGDMSIVGPRPEIKKYVDMFESDYQEILTIKPGITDYAAIEFKNEESILRNYKNRDEGYMREILPRKIQLYKIYLRKKNFLLDIKLVFLTLLKLIK